MKRLHLVCNAHLDPVWMWDVNEGKSITLATFRSAAELCDEYDYIFCHNESLLYEFVEKYEPLLFQKIQELVKLGKWHIMGGWYLQPDCNMPMGESLMRQISVGKKYFKEKFGVNPTTAINFDSFGHDKGLVQILKANGYDSYLFCRPMPDLLELPDNQFNWLGYDGSKIKCCRIGDEFMYCTGLSQAKEFIPKKAECWKKNEAGIALWGVGNHGGGPSRIDLQDVAELIENTSDYEILHSTPELFFSEVNPTLNIDQSLHCLVGCYSSMTSIKQAHIELENKLYFTEKLCSLAVLNGKKVYNEKDFEEATKMLLFTEFHDTLSGTITEEGEKTTLNYCHHACYLLDELRDKAFFSLIEDFKRPKPDTYPIYVCNTSAYNRETVIETEFLILDPIMSDAEQYSVYVTLNGAPVKSQVLKELSNINYDRRKRISFKADLTAASVTCFDVEVKVEPKKHLQKTNGDIVFKDSCKELLISSKTGLLESYIVDGIEYISGSAFEPIIFDDNCDPWGWYFDAIGKNPVNAVLDSPTSGMFSGFESVNVVENGPVMTAVESFFGYNETRIRIYYKLYKDLPYIDISLDVFWMEREKTLKIKIPCAVQGEFIGQGVYGTDVFMQNGHENIAHRFIGIRNNQKVVALINNCCYGASAKDGAIYQTLLRGIAYCAHPIDDRQLIETDRYIPFAEQGKRNFDFRFMVCSDELVDNKSLEFCEPIYALNAYPAGEGVSLQSYYIDNLAITLAALFKEDGQFVARVFNNTNSNQKGKLVFGNSEYPISLKPYAFDTVGLSHTIV